MRTLVPILITAFVGAFMILKFFLVHEGVRDIANELEQWGVITLAFAIILGVLNLARINLKAVLERKRDWGYKLILLVCMFGMMTAGGVKWYRDIDAARAQKALETARAANPVPDGASPPSVVVDATRASETAEQRAKFTVFTFIFDQVYTPLSATIYALLAFYVASAAFRSFRAKSLHSALLLIAAVIVMIGRVPVGKVIWSGFPVVQEWIMVWPNTAGQRAILMGAAIGMIATGIRVIFGIERPYLKG